MKIYTIILLLIPLQIRKLLKIDPLFVPGKSSNRLSTISRTDPCKKNAWVAVGLFCKSIIYMKPNNVPGRTYIVRKPDLFDSTSDMGVAPINIHYTLQSPN